MPPAAADDFQELLALLFGASERYHSVRATVRHRRRGGLVTEAINRYVEYGFRNNILSNFNPPYHEPRYREYGDLDEISLSSRRGGPTSSLTNERSRRAPRQRQHTCCGGLREGVMYSSGRATFVGEGVT
jgi:hypothetical protein